MLALDSTLVKRSKVRFPRGYGNSRGLAEFGSAKYLAQDFKQSQIAIKSFFGYIVK
jgi:hypothetical protein